MFNNIFSKGLTIIICWATFLSWGIYLFNFSYYPKLKTFSGNADLPEEKFGFTGSYFYSFLDQIGEIGQSAYFSFQLFDYLNGIFIGFTFFVTIYYLLNKLETRKLFKALLIFPFLLSILDVLENTLFIYLIYKLPSRYHQIISLAGDITNLKLIVGGVSFSIILVCILILLFNTIYKKIKSN